MKFFCESEIIHGSFLQWKKMNSSLAFTIYACIFFLHMPQRTFQSWLRVKEVPLICKINIWTEAEWLQPFSPMHFPHNLISRAASLLHTSHFHSQDCAGPLAITASPRCLSDSPSFSSSSLHVGPSFTSPYFPRALFASLSLFSFPSTGVTGGSWLQANVRRLILIKARTATQCLPALKISKCLIFKWS